MRKPVPTSRDLFIPKKSAASRGKGFLTSPVRRIKDRDRSPKTSAVDAQHMQDWRERLEKTHEQIQSIIAHRKFETYFQPIVDLQSGRPVGAEALSRFAPLPVRPPDAWFVEAASVGLGVELELAALEMAIGQLSHLPANLYLSVNASVPTLMSERFRALIAAVPAERIVVELTEHAEVDDYEQLEKSIKGIRSTGIRLAVDDAGSGYSSLQHILNLQPDVIKLDIGLTRGIDRDPARLALGRALLKFGFDAYRASIVAEGIETVGEYETLRSLGCPAGQGFYLGRPSRLAIQHLAPIAPMPLLADRIRSVSNGAAVKGSVLNGAATTTVATDGRSGPVDDRDDVDPADELPEEEIVRTLYRRA